MNTSLPTIKAVSYARYSSNNQREESIAAQERAISIFADHNNYEIIRNYSDKARSGKTAQREAFQQMIADAAKKDFQVVIFHKLDRFSRDVGDLNYYQRELKMHEVYLVSVEERLENSPQGDLLKNIIASINAFYCKNLAAEVMKGLKENAYSCKTTGGLPPLGYDFVDKKYVINDVEAQAIKLVFEMYDAGYGYNVIINRLNELGFKTKRGQYFGKNSLYELIRNERYAGVFIYNKHSARRPDGSRARTAKSENEIIRIPGGIPAIIGKDIWERCNQRMAENKKRGGKFLAKETYLLSGLIFCGECGYAMSGNARYPAKGLPKYITYRCSHRHLTHQCDNKEIKRDIVERFVLGQLWNYLLMDGIVPELTKRLNTYIKEHTQITAPQKRSYQQRLSALSIKKNNMLDAIANLGYSAEFSQKLREIESETKNISNLLESAENVPVIGEIKQAQVKQYIEDIKSGLAQKNPMQLKRLLETFIERVDVFKDEVHVTYKFELPASEKGNATYLFEQNASRAGLKVTTA